MAVICKHALAFSRRQAIAPSLINLNEIIASTEKMLSHLLSENISLTTSLAPDLWPVIMDPTQVEQILMNLTLNARDAMPDGGNFY